jgi:hypothetical protein
MVLRPSKKIARLYAQMEGSPVQSLMKTLTGLLGFPDGDLDAGKRLGDARFLGVELYKARRGGVQEDAIPATRFQDPVGGRANSPGNEPVRDLL